MGKEKKKKVGWKREQRDKHSQRVDERVREVEKFKGYGADPEDLQKIDKFFKMAKKYLWKWERRGKRRR